MQWHKELERRPKLGVKFSNMGENKRVPPIKFWEEEVSMIISSYAEDKGKSTRP